VPCRLPRPSLPRLHRLLILPPVSSLLTLPSPAGGGGAVSRQARVHLHQCAPGLHVPGGHAAEREPAVPARQAGQTGAAICRESLPCHPGRRVRRGRRRAGCPGCRACHGKQQTGPVVCACCTLLTVAAAAAAAAAAAHFACAGQGVPAPSPLRCVQTQVGSPNGEGCIFLGCCAALNMTLAMNETV
jgi:hypothetical protein